VFPFGTQPIIFEAKGSDLVTIALNNANAVVNPDPSSRVLQQSGIIYSFRERMEAAELVRVMVGDSLVDPNKMYRIAATDGILANWKDLTGTELAADPLRPEYSVLGLVERRIRKEMLSAPPAIGGTFLE
jgi:hypothetical protein